MKKITAIVLFLIASSCATLKPIKPKEISKETSVSKSFDKTWESVIKFLTNNNVPIKTIEKQSGLIVTEEMTFSSLSNDKRIDCDAFYINQNPVDVPGRVKYNIYVRRVSEVETSVTVNIFSSAYHVSTGHSPSTTELKCYSTGKQEEKIFAFVKEP